MNEPIIEIKNVVKEYPIRRGFRDLRGQGGVLDWIRGKKSEHFRALDNVSFDIYRGETVGIIGKNGSGKSTLLKIIAGVTLPTEGRVIVYGRVASLLELGAGFHPLLTGRENIYLNAGLLGMRRAQVNEVIEQIIDFSGIREFIDQPVDTYSSGMYVRIGFAVASFVNPDIFLVDEVLSVGDEEFQRKCRQRIGELREQGKTIVFVSHDLGTVNALCNRVFLLDKGKLIDRGSVSATIDYYLRQIGRAEGIHTISSPNKNIEAIFSHGKLSLFHDKKEITSPLGIEGVLVHLQQVHPSSMGDWLVTEREDQSLIAQGTLYRLPVEWKWNVEIKNKHIELNARYKLNKEIPIQALEFRIFLPEIYDHFFYNGNENKFAPIVPGNLGWTTMVPPKIGENSTFLLTSLNSDEYPLLKIEFETSEPGSSLTIGNTDYIGRSRFICCHLQIPETSSLLQMGEHKIGNIRISLAEKEEYEAWKTAWIQQRTITLKDIEARLGEGFIEFISKKDKKLLTQAVHLHTQFRLQGMWFLSQTFLWNTPYKENDTWIWEGESQRFPIRLKWELLPKTEENLLYSKIWLIVKEPLSLEEYNISVGLIYAYQHWKTSFETGEFTEIPPEQTEYIHLNKNYNPSEYIYAIGNKLPNVFLFTHQKNSFRMSAINPEYSLHARIIQAIATPEQKSVFNLQTGSHLLFDGGIQFSFPEDSNQDEITI
ncbi:MAG TPA: ABC transporter ATP-binding protein [Candidatus Hydrogenedens sp.]|nr:ABC transporter ATP-binding protein [Candidatus Hydrogenedens sp.]